MKPIVTISVMAVLFVVVPSPCFALWGIVPVSNERAKEMSMDIRSNAAGPNHVTVELEFKTEGALKNFSRVDMRIGAGDNPPVTAALREDRSKAGRVMVSLTADRGHLDQIHLWIMVPDRLGGTVHDVRVKDFVERKNNR